MRDDSSSDSDKTRREFLKTAVGTTAALGLAGAAQAAKSDKPETAKAASSDKKDDAFPTRVLGKTGARVSILGCGSGNKFLQESPDDDKPLAVIERALALGITYFDTAASYGPDRRSERLYGQVLPKHRSSIFLATKTDERTYDGAMRSVEESLKRLKVDSLDLMQIHSAGPKDDLAAWDKPDGVVTALRKLKEQKVTRFIGFTGHLEADVHKKVIETFDLDTVLMALNAANHKRFRDVALPAAVKKEMGVIAMKVLRDLVGKAEARELLASAWELPITTVITGMSSLESLEENAKLARTFTPGAVDTKATAERLERDVDPAHVSWMQPGYRDAELA
jgi:aryl-alcohol dehydrogenase-like predicted oxidoreductase